jgi:flavodoxin
MTRTKLLLATAVVLVLAVGVHFLLDQMLWVDTAPYEGPAAGEARTLVVHYSRTGNTQGAAKEVARYFQADMLQIEAPQYGLTLEGQTLAAKHADERVRSAPIEHEPVDLTSYDLVVLCSPTWWFRPAVPVWAFVQNHEFDGTRVFLLMTGNSRLKDEYTEEFAALLAERGGVFLDNLFVRRGRFMWQKSSMAVAAEVRRALESRESMWPGTARPR